MSNTTATNAITIPSILIAMITPVIMYTMELTGGLEVTPPFEVSGGVEVTASSKETEDLEVIVSSASDDVSTTGAVVLPTGFLASDE